MGWVQILGSTDRCTSGPLLSFSVATFSHDPLIATKLTLELSSVSILYYHRAILECVTWGENMGEMAQSRSFISGNSKTSQGPEPTSSTAPAGVLFEVNISNPYVIIPRDSLDHTSNQIEVDLGHIVIDNKMVSLKKALGTRRESQTKRKNLVDIAVAQSRQRANKDTTPLVSVRSRRVIDGKVTKRSDPVSFTSDLSTASINTEGRNSSDLDEGLDDDANKIIINRMSVKVEQFTVSLKVNSVIHPFVRKTGAFFSVDLPIGDKEHTRPDATVFN